VWQVALGDLPSIIVIAKEILVERVQLLKSALSGRAFLYFAYPAQISGDQPWIAAD